MPTNGKIIKISQLALDSAKEHFSVDLRTANIKFAITKSIHENFKCYEKIFKIVEDETPKEKDLMIQQ